MERNCVSLETAKKLKVAGFPQHTAQIWVIISGSEPFLAKYRETDGLLNVAAPTAQEIADQLPREFELNSDCDGTYWARHEGQQGTSMHPTLAEALAALYLKLNKETT